jgi:Flp pilus assembly protein protease CpaA
MQLTGLMIYSVAAMFISTSDLRCRIIRNRDLIIFLIVGVISNSSNLSFESFRSLIWISLCCLVLALVFQGKIGAGDIKLFWVVSFWTSGFPNWLEGLTIAWILGGLFAIAYAVFNSRHKQRKLSIPFAPFIFLGFLPVI